MLDSITDSTVESGDMEWRRLGNTILLNERGRVQLDLDHEPHTRHAEIKARYPGRSEKERDQDRSRPNRGGDK